MENPQTMQNKDNTEEWRLALIGIIVTDWDAVAALNAVLHDYAQYIIGRMGIPYKARNRNIISVAIDAPLSVANALAGKIGRLEGLTAKMLTASQ
jgi:putative iron-only hydrogenase system regulator